MSTLSVRVDPEVERQLGAQGTQAVLRRVDRTGDCTVCHQTLGSRPLALTLHWAGGVKDLALIEVTHAACQASMYLPDMTSRTPTHRTVALRWPSLGPIVLI